MNPHSAPAPRRPAADAPVRDREETFLRRFVGRESELARFRAALDQSPGTVPVLALHGPSGIGKTQLLRRFAVEARRRGRFVVEVDAARTGPTKEAFAAAADVPRTGRPVLLVDGADRLGPLEGWFRDRYLTGLPPGSLVVLAGREPPGLRWRTDPAWADTLRVGRLDRLSRAESGRLLQDAAPGGITARSARLAFAAGHPSPSASPPRAWTCRPGASGVPSPRLSPNSWTGWSTRFPPPCTARPSISARTSPRPPRTCFGPFCRNRRTRSSTGCAVSPTPPAAPPGCGCCPS
ncbi:ATP-binding protein [Streptomyces sp. AD2-2]|nr:ATP-binding protein [Streptomyces sp. AD2-2]